MIEANPTSHAAAVKSQSPKLTSELQYLPEMNTQLIKLTIQEADKRVKTAESQRLAASWILYRTSKGFADSTQAFLKLKKRLNKKNLPLSPTRGPRVRLANPAMDTAKMMVMAARNRLRSKKQDAKSAYAEAEKEEKIALAARDVVEREEDAEKSRRRRDGGK
jgi:hypothetical protein